MVTRTRLRTPSLVLTALAIATSILSVALGLPWAALSFVAVAGCSAVLLLSLRHPAPLVAAHDLIRRIPVPREILPAPVSEPPRQPPVVRAD
jgi:hypothetical protein